MVITRLSKWCIALARDASDFHQRNSLAQKRRKGHLLWLERIIRQLNSKRDAQAFALGRVHRQRPNRIEIEPSRARLHVAPIAANVENIHEWQAGDLLHVLLECFPSRPRGQRRPTFLPAVADQSKSRIPDRPLRWRRKQHGFLDVILFNIKRTLIQPLGDGRTEGEVTALTKRS